MRRLLLWLCLFCLAFSAETEKRAEVWTVEPFSGALSGQTVTVTRALWADGPLTPEGLEGSPRPEMVYALRCLGEALPDGTLNVVSMGGYGAELALPEGEAGAWLLENAWRFGLTAAREPEEEGNRVCLRRVGPVHAAAMRALNMDLEAYLLFLRRAEQAALLRNGRAVGWVFRVPEGEAVSFSLPEGEAFSVSGDGEGAVIIAVGSGC